MQYLLVRTDRDQIDESADLRFFASTAKLIKFVHNQEKKDASKYAYFDDGFRYQLFTLNSLGLMHAPTDDEGILFTIEQL